MAELISEVHKYIGKMLKTQGKKKDGADYKIWKLQFDVGGTYPWTVSMFDPASDKSIQATAMVEGEYYEVVYKITEFESQYGTQKSKQAVLIKPSTADKETKGFNVDKNQPQTQQQAPNQKLGARDWVNFKDGYNKAMEGKTEKSAIHMLGAYIANHYQTEATDLIELCKSNFK